MNWKTKEILLGGRKSINDTGVFSEDQISILTKMMDAITDALERETSCISSGINHIM